MVPPPPPPTSLLGLDSFLPYKGYNGPKDGYVFDTDREHGAGYYRTKTPQKPPTPGASWGTADSSQMLPSFSPVVPSLYYPSSPSSYLPAPFTSSFPLKRSLTAPVYSTRTCSSSSHPFSTPSSPASLLYPGVLDLLPDIDPSPEQAAIISALVDSGNHVLVSAVAGSGKTSTMLLACSELQRRRPDATVTIISYNRALRDSTEKRAKEWKLRNCYVTTVHSLANRHYGIDCSTDVGLVSIIKDDPPLARPPRRDQFFFIDEAQDFTSKLMDVVMKYLRDLTRYFISLHDVSFRPQFGVFGDECQAVYKFRQSDSRFLTEIDNYLPDWRPALYRLPSAPGPGAWEKLPLHSTNRLTSNMVRFMNEAIRRKVSHAVIKTTKSHAFNNPPISYCVGSSFLIAFDLAKKVSDHVKSGQSKPSDWIVIQFSVKSSEKMNEKATPLHMFERSLCKAGSVPVHIKESDEPSDGSLGLGKLLITTRHSAKGLERKHAIVFGFANWLSRYQSKSESDENQQSKAEVEEAPQSKSKEIDEAWFVALTRASHSLTIVGERCSSERLPFIVKPAFDALVDQGVIKVVSARDYVDDEEAESKKEVKNQPGKSWFVDRLIEGVPNEVAVTCLSRLSFKRTDVGPSAVINISTSVGGDNEKGAESVSGVTAKSMLSLLEQQQQQRARREHNAKLRRLETEVSGLHASIKEMEGRKSQVQQREVKEQDEAEVNGGTSAEDDAGDDEAASRLKSEQIVFAENWLIEHRELVREKEMELSALHAGEIPVMCTMWSQLKELRTKDLPEVIAEKWEAFQKTMGEPKINSPVSYFLRLSALWISVFSHYQKGYVNKLVQIQRWDWLSPESAREIVDRLKLNLGDGWDDDLNTNSQCKTETLVCCADKFQIVRGSSAAMSTYCLKGVFDFVTETDAWRVQCRSGEITVLEKLELAMCAYCVFQDEEVSLSTNPGEFLRGGGFNDLPDVVRNTAGLRRRVFRVLNILTNESWELDLSDESKWAALKEVGDQLIQMKLYPSRGLDESQPALPPDGLAARARREIHERLDHTHSSRIQVEREVFSREDEDNARNKKLRVDETK